MWQFRIRDWFWLVLCMVAFIVGNETRRPIILEWRNQGAMGVWFIKPDDMPMDKDGRRILKVMFDKDKVLQADLEGKE